MSGVERRGAKDRSPPTCAQTTEHGLENGNKEDLADDGPPADPQRPASSHLKP